MPDCCSYILLLTAPVQTDWEYVTSKVDMVGSSWDENAMCVYFTSGDVAKLDMTTEKGKGALALSAKVGGLSIKVIFDQESTPTGNCNNGKTVLNHGIMQLL